MNPDLSGFAERSDRRKFLVGVLFCSAAGLSAWRQPHIKIDYLGGRKLDTLISKSIGPWNFVTASGLVVPPDDQLAKATYAQTLMRVYSDGQNEPIMLLLAQSGSQTGFLQIHRPETCYTAGGYQITEPVPHPIRAGSKIIAANAMEASSGGHTEHIVYWTRIGNKLPGSWREQKVAVAELNLRGFVPDAILVRLSCVSNDGNAARAAIDSFVAALISSIPPSARPVLIGQ